MQSEMNKFLLTVFTVLIFTGGLRAALTITQSVPANNAVDVSVKSKIVLIFNEDVLTGDSACLLNGDTIKPSSIVGKYITFTPTVFDFATEQKLVIKKGAFKSKLNNDNYSGTTINFTTIAKPLPALKVFDAIVAKDGSSNYSTVQSAVNAAPEGRSAPWLIFIKNGSYEEQVIIPENKPFIHLIGQDVNKTIIHLSLNVGGEPAPGANADYWKHSVHNPASPVAGKEGSMVLMNASDFYAENISFINDWGVNSQAGPQALAMSSNGDRSVFYNCIFRSYQDTWMTPRSDKYRHYVKNCMIEGAVDFIYAGGECYFDSCNLVISRASGGYIVAPAHTRESKFGYVFMDCSVNAPVSTEVYYGRPWHNNPKTSFINTRLGKNVSIYPKGWVETMGGLPDVFADYNTLDYLGNKVDLSKRNNYYYIKDRTTGQITAFCYAKQYHTESEVSKMTVKNVLSGADSWNPKEKTNRLPSPKLLSNGKSGLSWNAIPYAICYLVFKGDSIVKMTTSTNYTAEKDGLYSVKSVNEYGGLSGMSNVVDTRIAAKEITAFEQLDLFYKKGVLKVKGIIASTRISVYNSAGILIRDVNVDKDSEIAIPGHKGILIIKTNSFDSVRVDKIASAS